MPCDKNLIVALDIGTSKIVAVIAKILPERNFEILGFGRQKSQGIRKGIVTNIETIVNSIRNVIDEAESMANCKIRHVYAGISGNHVRSFNSNGLIIIKNKEITAVDIDRVIETAKTVNIPTDQQILHVLKQEFTIDDQKDIYEPIGMSGLRLEVSTHLVTGSVRCIQNIKKCIHRCNLIVQNLVLQSLASSLSVLTDDEKRLGVILIDIGGGTTDIAIFTGGTIRYTSILPIAGNQITNDIATMLRISITDAENIKLRYGIAKKTFISKDELFEIPSSNKQQELRQIKYSTLVEIIEPRIEELFIQIRQIIYNSGYENLLISGVVVTGGSSQLSGIAELAEEIFSKPIRIGIPKYSGNLSEIMQNPSFSTVIGLLQASYTDHHKKKLELINFKTIIKHMKRWFIY